MDNIFYQYMMHLDELRYEQGFTISRFCEDVCTTRQYTRYLNREQLISLDKFIKFLNKLNITELVFYKSFHLKESSELSRVRNTGGKPVLGDWEDLEKDLLTYEGYTFISRSNKKFYDMWSIITPHMLKKIKRAPTLEKLKKLIDFPKCLTGTLYDLHDIAIIEWIAKLGFQFKETEALEFLDNMLMNINDFKIDRFFRGDMATIYASVAHLHALFGNFERCMEITDLGLEYHFKNQTFAALANLYYYKAMYYKDHGEIEKSKEYASLVLATKLVSNRSPKMYYDEMVNSDYGENPFPKILDLLQKNNS